MKSSRLLLPAALLAFLALSVSCQQAGSRSNPAPNPRAVAAPPKAVEPRAAAAASPAPAAAAQSTAATAQATAAKPADESVVLTLAGGRVVIDLFEEDCPAHSENFKRLARSGYLNGLGFHRVCYGFAQGGDPVASARAAVEQTIPPEIKRPLVRGAVVAARRSDEQNPHRESHGSQFFIMKVPYPGFDGQYTVFGRVVEGMELVDKIPEGEREANYVVPPGLSEKILRAEVLLAPRS